MKSTGVVRKVDELGRFVLPTEIRKIHNIIANDELEFFIDDENIILKKCESACVFCGSIDGIVTFNRHSVCAECAKTIAARIDK